MLNPIEAALVANLLRPRVQTLAELHSAQIQSLPPGDDSWMETEDQLETAWAALKKVEGIR